jgi:hypothetical protein
MAGVTAKVTLYQDRTWLNRVMRHFEVSAHDAAEIAAKRGAELSRALAPKKTLRLVSHIDYWVEGKTGAAWGVHGDEKLLAYAASQDRGSLPHEIGKPGQRLYNEEEGFKARGPVWHPGTRPTNFMEEAEYQLERDLHSIVEAELESGVL